MNIINSHLCRLDYMRFLKFFTIVFLEKDKFTCHSPSPQNKPRRKPPREIS